ncbi:MAG: hypothetical protein GXO74_06310 [Calditrichaeota bacterium]|nr:hypothetical protein [Calditrichota bacterium]
MARKLILTVLVCGFWSSSFFLTSCTKPTPIEPKAAPQNATFDVVNDITNDEVWFSRDVRTIKADVSVKNATLTIEAGATILFEAGASLTIGDSAKIIADGSDEPIVFSGTQETPGFWKFIRFSPNSFADSSQLIRCHFKFGGGDSLLQATIICDNSDPLIAHCTITDGASNGVIFLGDCRQASFFENTIQNCNGAPVLIDAANVAALGTNTYANNTDNVIRIGNGRISEDVVWYPQDIPYCFSQGALLENAHLTLAPGSTLQFEAGQSFRVRNFASVTADGSLEQIIFTARDSSGWQGIIFEENANATDSKIANCTIEKAGVGGDFPANIVVKNSGVDIFGCKIIDSESSGIYFASKNIAGEFANNFFDNNQNGAICLQAGAVDKLSPQFYGSSGNNNIIVRGGTIEGLIQSNAYWKNTNTSYEIVSAIRVENATLTIEAGTNLIMHHDAEFDIGSQGGLIADGSQQAIVFSGQQQSHGSWRQIYFSPNANAANCQLINCHILYGGSNQVLPGMIYCDQVAPIIRNCYIGFSATYGIYLNGSVTLSELSTNQFSYNLYGDVFPAP